MLFGKNVTASVTSKWVNRFARLNDKLLSEHALPLGTAWVGQPFPHAQWVDTSDEVAQILGWPSDWHEDSQALSVFSGQAQWPGMQPMATVYSGHQFGQWAGQLGDGRALLLGEIATAQGAMEIQLKGAGPTPYSRGGDGRAVLRSSVREYLCSEAMHGLGIPTSRALALVASPLPVLREAPETAAVVTRVAASFIRFGHFEHFAHHAHPKAHSTLKALLDFVIEQYLPQLGSGLDPADRAQALLYYCCDATADLMAQWQSVGFCHGVMNTDNMSILGLTIDYGPFGFMDAFDPDHVCNHSDTSGRYRWRFQPHVARWNLSALAQALLVVVPNAGIQDSQEQQNIVEILQNFDTRFQHQMLSRWRAKLGLLAHLPEDESLVTDWLQLLARNRVDFTIAFRRLADFELAIAPNAHATSFLRDLFLDRLAFDNWAQRYKDRLLKESSQDQQRKVRMNQVNPWVVLRNHLAQIAIDKAQVGDFSEIKRLRQALEKPFIEQAQYAAYADFPPDWADKLEVSCSS